jgi:3-methyl-2-oxobutanoate hydroxymethyltransferase
MEKRRDGDRAPGSGDRRTNDKEADERQAVVTAPEVAASKGRRRLVMVTAVDEPSGRIADAAGVDLVLVGDSLAMAALGRPDTLSVTMDEMVHHTRAVAAGVHRALLIADMPFGSYQASVAEAVRNACRLVADGGARAVKLEGAREEEVAAIVRAGIPVVAHLGLTPQSFHRLGGYRVQARDVDDAVALVAQAEALAAAGAFLLVLEAIPSPVAAVVTRRLEIPTIGIGAGAGCDGQVMVWADMLGLSQGPLPRFVRPYADLGRIARDAVAAYAADVRAGRYPANGESYPTPPGLAEALERRLERE